MNRNAILGTFSAILFLVLFVLVARGQVSAIARNKLNPLEIKLMAAEIDSNETNRQLIVANNRFGFKLLTNLLAQKPNQNVFVSPLSITIALKMLQNGANGETLKAIKEVLELTELSDVQSDRSYQQLLKTLKSLDSEVQLSLANSLWVNQNIPLKDQFIDSSQKYYQGQVTNLDFTQSQAQDTINRWVEQQTQGKITAVVDALKPEDILFLINAIYFKGSWTNRFDSSLTTEQPFYSTANNSQPQPMMSQTGDYRYLETEQFQAVRLPYGSEKLSMYIFLPSENINLTGFSQQLTAANWQQWISLMRSRQGNLEIPQFKLEYGTNLNSALATLGMSISMGEQADFSRMSEASVKIDQIEHKTFIEVNEEGTEAAGVTSGQIGITSFEPPTQPFTMKVNRPFFCAIRDDVSGTILFMGNIIDPS